MKRLEKLAMALRLLIKTKTPVQGDLIERHDETRDFGAMASQIQLTHDAELFAGVIYIRH